MEAAAQHDLAGEAAGHAREVHEDGLGYVLRQMRVAPHQPNRGGMNEVEVAGDQLMKGWFGAVLNVIGEQFLAVRHFQFTIKDPRKAEIRQKLHAALIAFSIRDYVLPLQTNS